MQSYKKNINYRSISILGVKVNFINLAQALTEVKNWVNYNKKHQITTPNPEQIVLAQKDYRFKKILNKSKLSICDGVGLLWAARIKNFTNHQPPNLHRLSGTTLMYALCKMAAKNKWRVFLLGGKNQTAKHAAQNLKSIINNQSLTINHYAGPQNIKKETNKERKKSIDRINKFNPHFLFVAFGAPAQEKWIAKNLQKLNINAAMGVGGAFDYFAKNVSRAPKWVRKAGLEWLWRLFCQPWRIKRQMRLLKFILLFFLHSQKPKH